MTYLLHVIGFILWASGLMGLSIALRTKKEFPSDAALGHLGKIYGRLADIGAALTVTGGLWTAIVFKSFQFQWFHIKMTLIMVLLGLHIVTRIKALKSSTPSRFQQSAPFIIAFVLMLIAYVAVTKAAF